MPSALIPSNRMAAISRRALLAGLPGLLRGELPPTELRRLRDPATEFEILRYTDPAWSSLLAPAHLRSVSRNNNFLIFCSDKSGSFQLARMDLKTGEARQVTRFAEGVEPRSFALTRDDRALWCVHTDAIEQIALAGGRVRTLYQAPRDWRITEFAPFDTPGWFAVIENRAERFRVRFVRAQTAAGETLFEAGETISLLRPRPRRLEALISRSGRLSTVRQDGRGPRDIAVAGAPAQAHWSGDGATLFYLSVPAEIGKLNQIREYVPETREDKLIAPTSQFVTFARNGDASVFVGVSGSKASPYVLLLLRTTRREMTLSEHKASAPAAVSIFFTPDSQRVFYHSDRQGKPAIYAVPAEKFVERTDERDT